MPGRPLTIALALSVTAAACWLSWPLLQGQETVAPADLPPVPQGVDVLARGPIYEAYASLAVDPIASKIFPKRPPLPLDEQPPADKPDGDFLWIGGYWAWDDDRTDFLVGLRRLANAATRQAVDRRLLARARAMAGSGCPASGPSRPGSRPPSR